MMELADVVPLVLVLLMTSDTEEFLSRLVEEQLPWFSW
jgi:hypothetical protein